MEGISACLQAPFHNDSDGSSPAMRRCIRASKSGPKSLFRLIWTAGEPMACHGRRFTERAHESYRLVGAFRPWAPQRNCRKEGEADGRLRQRCGR